MEFVSSKQDNKKKNKKGDSEEDEEEEEEEEEEEVNVNDISSVLFIKSNLHFFHG